MVVALGIKNGVYIFNNNGTDWQLIKNTNNQKFNCILEAGDFIYLTDTSRTIYVLNRGKEKLIGLTKLNLYGKITAFAASPKYQNVTEMMVGTSKGTYRFTLEKPEEIKKIKNLPTDLVTDIKYSDRDQNSISVLYGNKGYYLSEDNGKSWKRINKGLSGDKQAIQYCVPQFSSLETYSSNLEEMIWICGFDGLFMLDKEKRIWNQLNTLSKNLLVGLAVSQNHLYDSSLAVLTYLNGPLISTNGGKGWKESRKDGIITENLNSEGFIRLVDITYPYSTSSDLTAISTSNIYQYKVKTNSWSNKKMFANSNAVTKILNSIFSGKEIIYKNKGDVPYIFERIKASDSYLLLTNKGSIFYYDEKTSSIDQLIRLNKTITSLSVSPGYNVDSLICIGTKENGIILVKGRKLKHIKLEGLKFIVQFSPDFIIDSTIFASGSDGLYKSSDRGLNWTKLEIPTHSGLIVSLAISPFYSTDQTFLITIKGEGVFKSVNGGESFINISEDLYHLNHQFSPLDFFPPNSGAIKFSPNFNIDSTIYAYSGLSVFKTCNAGKSWQELAEINIETRKTSLDLIKGVVFEFKQELVFLFVVFLLLAVSVYFIFHFKNKKATI